MERKVIAKAYESPKIDSVKLVIEGSILDASTGLDGGGGTDGEGME